MKINDKIRQDGGFPQIDQPNANEILLTADQVAEILSVPIETLYQWTSRGKIAHFKISRRMIRFRRSDIDDFLNRSFFSPISTISEQRVKPTRRITRVKGGDAAIERIIKNAITGSKN